MSTTRRLTPEQIVSLDQFSSWLLSDEGAIEIGICPCCCKELTSDEDREIVSAYLGRKATERLTDIARATQNTVRSLIKKGFR